MSSRKTSSKRKQNHRHQGMRKSRPGRTWRPWFEGLEDRCVPAGPSLTASTFSASQFADNIEAIVDGNVIGYGYAINQDNAMVRNGGDGSARMAPDLNPLAFTAATKTEIASVAKPITAAATHKLLYDQNLPLTTPIGNYLPPEWDVHSSVAAITFAQLMTHRSGFTTYVLTYAGLADLVETDVSATNGDKKYESTNYSMLRVIIPYLWLGSGVDDLADSSPFTKDKVIALLYEAYVKENVFEPAGVFDADTQLTGPNPTLLYAFPDDNTPGMPQENGLLEAGAKGWKLSALDLARFLRTLRHTENILSNEARGLMDTPVMPGDYPGWADQYGMFGLYLAHNGGNHQNAAGKKLAQAVIMNFPNDVEAAYVQNSNSAPGTPSTFSRMIQAYDNAWTDLVIDGSSSADTFELRINPNDSDLIDIKLGNATYTRWIDSLDSLTLNGFGGADTFLIRDVPASLSLIIRAGSSNDDINLTDGTGYASILGDVLIHGDGGNDDLYIQAYLGALVTFDGDSGSDEIQLLDSSGIFAENYHVTQTTLSKDAWNSYLAYQELEQAYVSTTNGNNTIYVHSTATGVPLTIDTNAGLNVILVGGDDYDTNIRSDVTVHGDFGHDVLAIQDREDNFTGDTYTIQPGQFSKSSTDAVLNFTFIQELVLQTTDEADDVDVEGIEAGTEVRIYTYGGQDDVRLAPTARQLDDIGGDVLIDMGGDLLDEVRLYDQDDTGNDIYTIDETEFTKTGFGTLEFENVPSLTLYANGANNTIRVNHLAADVHWTVRGGEGDELVQVGYATRDLDTDLLGSLSLWGEGNSAFGQDKLQFLDSLDQAGSDDYSIGLSSFSKTGTESWFYSGFEDVVISANDFANTIEVAGFGSDFAERKLTVNARGGDDEVILGAGYHRLDFISDHVHVHGGSGEDTILLDDTTYASQRDFTFENGSVDASGLFGTMSYASIAHLTVEAGEGDDDFDVRVLPGATDLEVYGNNGNDDLIAAGVSQSLNSLGGGVTFRGGFGTDTAVLHDEQSPEANVYTLTATLFGGDISRPGVVFAYDGMQEVTLNANDLGDTLNVEQTPFATTVAINAGGGNDWFYLSPTAHDLGDLNGRLNIDGGAGLDQVYAFDFNADVPGPYTVTPTEVTRPNSAGFGHGNVERIYLELGGAANTVDVEGTTPGTELHILANGGNDVVNLLAPPVSLVVVSGGANEDTVNVLGTDGADGFKLRGEQLRIGDGTILTTDVEARTLDTGGGVDNLRIDSVPGTKEHFRIQAGVNPGEGLLLPGLASLLSFVHLEAFKVVGTAGDNDRLTFDGTADADQFDLDLSAQGTAGDPLLVLRRPADGAAMLTLRDAVNLVTPLVNGLGGLDVFNVHVEPGTPRNIRLNGSSPTGMAIGDELNVTYLEQGAAVDWSPSQLDPDAGLIDILFAASDFRITYDDMEAVELIPS